MDEDSGTRQWPAPKGRNPTCEFCFWVTRLPDIASGIINNHKRTLTEIYSSGWRSAAECCTRGTWPDMSLPTQREEVERTGITAALLETLSSSSLTQHPSKPLCCWVLWEQSFQVLLIFHNQPSATMMHVKPLGVIRPLAQNWLDRISNMKSPSSSNGHWSFKTWPSGR